MPQDTPEEMEKKDGNRGIVTRWLLEITTFKNTFKSYFERGHLIVDRYRSEKGAKNNVLSVGSSEFNILWSNTETLKPVVFSGMPSPDVRRRYGDASDKVGRDSSIVLERALKTSNEMDKSDKEFRRCRLDFLLVSRAVARVIYEPTFSMKRVQLDPNDPTLADRENVQIDDDGNPFSEEEEVIFEECKTIYWPWDKFGHTAAKLWRDVDWIYYEWSFTKSQIQDMWGDAIADEISYTEVLDGVDAYKGLEALDKVPFQKAIVYEIFDKVTRRRLWISPGLTTKPLEVEDDPYGLEGFFPSPEPAMYTSTNNTLVPVPPFIFYQDQANELDIITGRINILIEQLVVRGIYDASIPEMETLLQQTDGKMIPIQNFQQIMEAGGLNSIVSYAPIQQIAEALVQLYQNRETIKQTIYEITGISDIVRGQSDPRETKGAQSLKAQFANIRMNDPAGEFNRFVRDIIEIKGEMIAEHFDAETLSMVSSMEVTEEMVALLRNDKLRGFSIDIEIDTTVFEDTAQQQKARTEFVKGLTAFMKEWLPALQQGAVTPEVFRAVFHFTMKPFKVGREIEQALSDWLDSMEDQKKQGAQAAQKQKQEAEAARQVEFQQMQAELKEVLATVQKKGAETEKIQAQIKEILAGIGISDAQTIIAAHTASQSGKTVQ